MEITTRELSGTTSATGFNLYWLEREYGVDGAETYLRQQIIDACAAFSTTTKSPLLIWRKDRPVLDQQQWVYAVVLYFTPTLGNPFYRLHRHEKNWSALIPGFLFVADANPCYDRAVPILRYVEGAFEPVVVTDELESRLAKIRSKWK
jgi:hypothetical protein